MQLTVVLHTQRHKWQRQCTGSSIFPSSGSGHCSPMLSCSVSNMVRQVNEAYEDRLAVSVAVCLPRDSEFQPNLQRRGSLRHNGRLTSFIKIITWVKKKQAANALIVGKTRSECELSSKRFHLDKTPSRCSNYIKTFN